MYIINKEEFKTKKAILARIRQIVDQNPDYQNLGREDFLFMLDVLRLHPHADQKIGSGVVRMYVRPHPAYYNSRCFFGVRVDGTRFDFSFNECLRPRSHAANVKLCFRFAIDKDTFAYKRRVYDDIGHCEVSGKPLDFYSSHVHHAGENTFEKILSDFVELHGIELDDVEIESSDTGRDSLVDKNLERAFVEFHRERATLQLIDDQVHSEITKLA